MKKRKISYVLPLLAALLVFQACSIARPERTLEVSIPVHPWESVSGNKLWYTLRWTYGDEVRSAYVPSDERNVSISVPAGETVLIAAFPLGDMSPFGAAVTPLDTDPTVVLSQNDGIMAGELLDVDRVVTSRLNYDELASDMRSMTDDFRNIEKVTLLRDLQNGVLSETSLKLVAPFGVDPFALPNGIWTSEFTRDPAIYVTEGLSAPMQMPEGVFRYLNTEMDRVLVLIVDSAGNSYSYLKQNLI
jgi:hypothetical protein